MTNSPAENAARPSDFDAIVEKVSASRKLGRTIVVVQGLGFVGSAMAVVTAASVDEAGEPFFHVIGVDRDDAVGRWKAAELNAGRPVVEADDPELDRLTRETALSLGTLDATVDQQVYQLADVVVVDLPLDADFSEDEDGVLLDIDSFREALRPVADRIPEDALVVLESTVPPGTTEKIVLPLFRASFEARGISSDPLIAHAYERVMPGPRYVESIRAFWRCFSGSSDEAARRTRQFLERVVDTENFPLTELSSPTASEMAKVLENSYRAMNIAFIEEWSKAAEQVGVNLFEVVEAIRRREGTHDNIRQPGFGVGGYCLPKDGLVAEWGLTELLDYDGSLEMTRGALLRNRRMPIHAFRLLERALPGGLDEKVIGVAGISYLASVGDTRNSPAEPFVDALVAAGAQVAVADPLVDSWPERPSIPLVEFGELAQDSDAIVFTISHTKWRDLSADCFGDRSKIILDATGLLSDELYGELISRGHTVIGVGRGDWNKELGI